jgi:hypothetical protein
MGVIIWPLFDGPRRYSESERRLRERRARKRQAVLSRMKDRVPIVASLLVGIIVGMGVMLGLMLKPNKAKAAEVHVPRFKVLCREVPHADGYPIIVLRDTEFNQDYLSYRGGLVLLGRGLTNAEGH